MIYPKFSQRILAAVVLVVLSALGAFFLVYLFNEKQNAALHAIQHQQQSAGNDGEVYKKDLLHESSLNIKRTTAAATTTTTTTATETTTDDNNWSHENERNANKLKLGNSNDEEDLYIDDFERPLTTVAKTPLKGNVETFITRLISKSNKADKHLKLNKNKQKSKRQETRNRNHNNADNLDALYDISHHYYDMADDDEYASGSGDFERGNYGYNDIAIDADTKNFIKRIGVWYRRRQTQQPTSSSTADNKHNYHKNSVKQHKSMRYRGGGKKTLTLDNLTNYDFQRSNVLAPKLLKDVRSTVADDSSRRHMMPKGLLCEEAGDGELCRMLFKRTRTQ